MYLLKLVSLMQAAILPLQRHAFVVRAVNPGPGGAPGPVLRDILGHGGVFVSMLNLTGHVLNEVPPSLVEKDVRSSYLLDTQQEMFRDQWPIHPIHRVYCTACYHNTTKYYAVFSKLR